MPESNSMINCRNCINWVDESLAQIIYQGAGEFLKVRTLVRNILQKIKGLGGFFLENEMGIRYCREKE